MEMNNLIGTGMVIGVAGATMKSMSKLKKKKRKKCKKRRKKCKKRRKK